MCQCHHYLLLNSLLGGSHRGILHSLAKELLHRGHKVTTLYYDEDTNYHLSDLGFNHKEIVINIKNQDGDVPFGNCSLK